MLIRADVRHLPLVDGCVQSVVTSPPFFGSYDFGDVGQLESPSDPVAYIEQLVHVFREVRRVLRPDGTVFLNLGDGLGAGVALESAFGLSLDGWFVAGAWPLQGHEHLFILTKAHDFFMNKHELSAYQPRLQHLRPQQSAGLRFPPFSEELVELCLRTGTAEGDRVLDPFIGSGTTAIVATRLRRRWVGTDVNVNDFRIRRDTMRGLGEIIVANHDIEADLKLPFQTLRERLADPGYYPPEKRFMLYAALVERLFEERTVVKRHAEAMMFDHEDETIGEKDLKDLQEIVKLVARK